MRSSGAPHNRPVSWEATLTPLSSPVRYRGAEKRSQGEGAADPRAPLHRPAFEALRSHF
jgi:hypothetical protein